MEFPVAGIQEPNRPCQSAINIERAVLTCWSAPSIHADLKPTFDLVAHSTYRGVSGVLRIDTGAPGPVVGIGMCTHGDEPSGLAPLWFSLREGFKEEFLARGSIIFMLHNLRAARSYFEISPDNESAQAQCRYIDTNMNRLPEDSLSQQSSRSYEIGRLRELYPIFCELDIGLDIHSTSADSTPMLIGVKGSCDDMIRGVPIETLLSFIVQVQRGKPISYFFGGSEKSTRTIGIEAGTHRDPNAFKTAIGAYLALLENLGMTRESNLLPKRQYKHYKVVTSIVFNDPDELLVSDFAGFPRVSKGDLLATCRDRRILSPIDGHALLGWKQLRPPKLGEEALFLSEPVERLIL